MSADQVTAGPDRPAVGQGPAGDPAEAQPPPAGVARLDEIRASMEQKKTGDTGAAS
jgi:hypothetical protein